MRLDFPSPTKPWYLKQIHLFSGLSQAELEELERLTRMYPIKSGESVYLPGDPGNTVYLLKKGQVKTVITGSSGKQVTFEILEPGEIFGELDVSGSSRRTMLAQALEDSLICAIRREDFERYLMQHPHLIVNLIKLIAVRFGKIQSQVEDLAHRDVPARLAHLLLVLSKTQGVPDGPDVRIRVKLTHHEIANLIGSRRETVSTILGRFRNKGFVQTKHRSVTIQNIEGLARLVPDVDLGEDIRHEVP